MTARKLGREEIDRLFDKQAEYERRNEDSDRKAAEDWYGSECLRRRTNHDFPNDLLSREKRWRQDRRSQIAGARFQARQIPKHLQKREVEKYREILKEGILEGAIQINETAEGFGIDTPSEKVAEYVLKHPTLKNYVPKSSDLEDGRFLLSTVNDLRKQQVKVVRNNLIEEFQAEDSADFMLIDLLVSDYFRCMYATKMEMNSLWQADQYSYEMFEVVAEGLQPYIHACQNQLLRVLKALDSRRERRYRPSFSHVTYSRTEINLKKWGTSLLFALAEITEKKQEQIDIDEIKQAMKKYLDDPNPETIPNDSIGYALRSYGLTNKVHTSDGNHYNISKHRVQVMLDEALKS